MAFDPINFDNSTLQACDVDASSNLLLMYPELFNFIDCSLNFGRIEQGSKTREHLTVNRDSTPHKTFYLDAIHWRGSRE
jgi:hypothetical protein